jgi:hypothetical protein
VRRYEAAGVDQVIFVSQAGRNRHEHICESRARGPRGHARVRGAARRARAPKASAWPRPAAALARREPARGRSASPSRPWTPARRRRARRRRRLRLHRDPVARRRASAAPARAAEQAFAFVRNRRPAPGGTVGSDIGLRVLFGGRRSASGRTRPRASRATSSTTCAPTARSSHG